MFKASRKTRHLFPLLKQKVALFGFNKNLRYTLKTSVSKNFNNYPSVYLSQQWFSQNKKNYKRKMTKDQMFKAQEQQLMKQQPDEDPTTYDKANTKLGKIFMLLGVIGLGAIVIYAQRKSKQKEDEFDENISGMVAVKPAAKVKVGGQWSLIDQTGKSFSSNNLIGSYYLIYFGFTKCPDICPTTLIKLSRVMRLIRKMPENNYLNIKLIFVSCDPERDTPKRMKQYLKHFDSEIIGVTGTSSNDPQLQKCMKNFKIYANKIPMSNGEYSMDHTTITYLMDGQNNYVDHLNPNLTEEQMAKAVVNRVLDNEYRRMKNRSEKKSTVSG